MSNTNNKKSTADSFMKSFDGKCKYDEEARKLRENRIRLNTWQKEQSKRNWVKNHRDS